MRSQNRTVQIAGIGLVLAFLASSAPFAHAQSSLDGFDPNANGTIRVVVVQPDGKILLGGDFTALAPNGGDTVTRNRIARLNPDGTLDTAFDPNANNSVNSIAVQADGNVLVGGSFTSIGGQSRNRIARLDNVTGLADSFDPNASSAVFALAIQTDGKILAGGFFDTIGGQPRNRIARLDPTSGLADSFDPNANGPEVFAIVIQPDNKILVAGFFTNIGGQARSNIARVDPNTALADSFDPNASDEVRCLALQEDGKVLAGGFFTQIGGQNRNSLARLDAITGAPDSFNPNPSGGVFALAVQQDGKILAGGEFFNIGGQSRHQIARLDQVTGLADSFNPNANSSINAIAVQSDGKILIGGGFTTLTPNGGTTNTRNRVARLETDGNLDRTLVANAAGSYVLAVAPQTDGKIIIGGLFSSVLGTTRNSMARLNSDLTLDSSFNPNANGTVYTMVTQSDGKILVGGDFTIIGGQSRHGMARLDPATALADSFNPNASFEVLTILPQSNGKILVGGSFSSIGGQSRNNIARLDPTTGAADSFNPNANSFVFTLAEQPDRKILVGGLFSGSNSVGGQTRNRIARLDSVTGLADSFNPNSNADVASLVIQSDGKILVGGNFNGTNSIGGQTRNNIARLDPATGAADSFNPNANDFLRTIMLQPDGRILISGAFTSVGGQTRNRIARLDPVSGAPDSFNPNANNGVSAIVPQRDGKILIGGSFSTMGGQTRQLFARLSNDTSAFQDLSATSNLITWLRGGSSPRLLRTTFDYSTDGVNYTPLGNGTPSGDNWTLGGLSLPPAQNLYIRGRGYYRGAHFNSTESVTESVRYGPIGTQTPTPTPTLPPTPTPTVSPTPTPTPTPSPTPTPCVSCTPTPTPTPPPPTCNTAEGFDDINILTPNGWYMQNNSQPGPGTTGWFQGATAVFTSHSGAANSYIGANFNNGTDTSTISNWLLTQPLLVQNGAQFTFWTRTVTKVAFPDRLQVRLSTNGTSTDVGTTATSVGDFVTLLLDINPTYTTSGYPTTWTNYVLTVSGVGSPVTGRIAFRYFVENGGPAGANSDYIGIDSVQYYSTACPTPTPATQCGTFSNVTPISIPAFWVASPYPSGVSVSDLGGAITNVTVAINGFSYPASVYVDILLVGPEGQNAIIMSDAGSYGNVSGINLILDDTAANSLPNGSPLVSGTFKPTNIFRPLCFDDVVIDSFPSPAPNPDGGSALSIFNGANPDGIWNLYVLADTPGPGSGSISGGWTITITTSNCSGPTPTPIPTPTPGAMHFAIGAPNSVYQGEPFQFTITAQDRFHNTVTNYPGIVHFSSSDPNATLPANTTLTNGTGTFTASLGGFMYRFAIVGTDTADPSINGASNCIFVGKQTPPPSVAILGSVGNCSAAAATPTPPASPTPASLPPVPNVLMTLTGSVSWTTLTDASGNYSFTNLISGGSYTVTPTRAALPPGSAGINTVDAIAIQRHFLLISVIPTGCRLTAADVNTNGSINVQDVIAVQRFFIGFTNGTGSTGQSRFSPASRSYSPLTSVQFAQNYATLILGDVVSPFANRPAETPSDALGFEIAPPTNARHISEDE